MREAIPCPDCGRIELRHHVERFTHAPVCHVRQLDALSERERRAKAEAWQLHKRINRLEKQGHRAVGRMGQGRAGLLTATRVLPSVQPLVRPSASRHA
jgi:hypothetical protein